MSREEFNRQGVLVATATEISKENRTTVAFVAQEFQPLGNIRVRFRFY
jgi:hypothetical protein